MVNKYTKLIPLRLVTMASTEYLVFVIRNPGILRLLLKVKGYKRFIGAWYIGYMIGEDDFLKPSQARLFANIYAYWVIAVISLDTYIDNSIGTMDAVKNLTQKIKLCLIDIKGANHVIVYPAEGLYENSVLLIFKNMCNTIFSLSAYYEHLNIECFIEYAELLIEGEELSFLSEKL